MTPTLERFHGQRLDLTVLTRRHEAEAYLREVLLTIGAEAQPVVYGAIRIWLHELPAEAQRQVLEEQRPLGKVLETEAIAHLSWPQAFFRVESDAHLAAVLRLASPSPLYGRRNVLLGGDRRLIAEVIEVLAPVETPD
jgi:chorismate-pyruvate lyase